MTQSATPRTNLEHMKFDLSKKAASGFVETLKTLLARMLMNDKDISTITGDFSSEEAAKVIHTLKEKADSLYNDLLSLAIEFCNDDLSVNPDRKGKKKESDDVKLCKAMKESIRE
ncbi:hypothetical protein MPER_03125 [Moniliophthora perniciosa FA553]|nr:hypothetical protein MPER_03125 [Moniliophthora perniciosa FA553]